MSGEFSQLKETIVDKILDQGQRLRNAMVQSILQNDPLTSEVFFSKTHNSPVSSLSSLHTRTAADKKLLEAFINGDYLSKQDEELALDTIRSLPVSEVCDTTERTLSNRCACSTCLSYHENNLKCHLRRDHDKPPKEDKLSDILKHVDSLRVSLQSIQLNELGLKKVGLCGKGGSYFVEYSIPEIFVKQQGLKTRSKVDSGLRGNHVSFCARGSSNVIYLKQIFTHEVANLYNQNLDKQDLTFHIKFKNSAQKKSGTLGFARLNFGVFRESETASCGKSLSIFLDESSGIALGSLKVTVQLGAGKLYFGKEFVDAVLTSRSVKEADISEESESEVSVKKVEKSPAEANKTITPRTPKTVCVREPEKVLKSPKKTQLEEKPAKLINPSEEDILFGFIYISEAQFLNFSPNSYVLCQPFCQNDTSASSIVYNSSNPLYNFCQNIPLVYDENLLLSLRENFTLLEFWHTTGQAEELFGLTRIPVHQFYLGYRNSIILKHLKRNKLPIIGTDWWEPIYSPESKELIGQVQILTALGTEDQVKNLEEERGFRQDLVRAKFPKIKEIPLTKPPNYWIKRDKITNKKSPPKFLVRPKHSDKETQSVMDEDNKKVESQDVLASFLKLLEQRQRPPCVENGTNTEPEVGPSGPPTRKTSDLLDSLQTALSLDGKPQKPPHFKAQIAINAANQLPCRRKMKTKSKRLKSKSLKQDDSGLPSTYVTFETLPNEPLQMTGVCAKSSSPQWGFCSEVCLPRDLLTNSQKRLIFKVWKRCTNAVLEPNLQTDLVLGFAALDLSVLSCGLPNVRGWFNIVDFSGKINGQINIHVNPLEKLTKTAITTPETSVLNNLLPDNSECNEVLSRALKRKFTELDEITQRLRLRLSEVVSEDSETSNDDVAEEFERDINDLCIEEDFHLVDFEAEAQKFGEILSAQKARKVQRGSEDSLRGKSEDQKRENGGSMLVMSSQDEEEEEKPVCEGTLTGGSGTSRSFDRDIMEGKHRIDNLLEKLSLINPLLDQPLSNRQISGCSADPQQDVEGIFQDLDRNSRPNITATNRFDPNEFQQLYGGSVGGVGKSEGSEEEGGTSGTSVITNFSECRPNPLGQGTSEEREA